LKKQKTEGKVICIGPINFIIGYKMAQMIHNVVFNQFNLKINKANFVL